MTTRKAAFGVLWLVAATVAVMPRTDARAETGDAPDAGVLRITALAVNMSTVGTGTNAVVDIAITRWSTAEERAHLIATMVDKGASALLGELQKAPSHGRFRLPGTVRPDPYSLSVGHDLRYAWQTEQPDGERRIVIATDRFIGFAETRDHPRVIDYPFTLFEIHVDKSGDGEGKLAVATKIRFDKTTNTVELENYASEHVRLQRLKAIPSS